MSAINIAIADGLIGYVLTDSISYTKKTILSEVPKVRTFPHMTAIVTGRGILPVLTSMYSDLSQCKDFDELCASMTGIILRNRLYRPFMLVDRLAARFAPARREPGADIKATGTCPIEIYAVGYSAREGRVKAVNAYSGSAPPFEVNEARIFLAPDIDDNQVDLPTQLTAMRDKDAWPKAQLSAMQTQISVSASRKDGEIIGGAAILTTVTKAGIGQRVLHRFPAS